MLALALIGQAAVLDSGPLDVGAGADDVGLGPPLSPSLCNARNTVASNATM